MIISASRRTDIPAYYSKWFLNRLKEKYVLVPNPYNTKQLSLVRLSPSNVDCIAFWTKNPAPIMDKLRAISCAGYKFYFQFTLTPYGKDLEPNLPPKEKLADTFLRLSDMVGPEHVIWRYDPIIINERLTVEYHLEQFSKMCGILGGATKRCVISFIDPYKTGFRSMDIHEMDFIAQNFSQTASRYGLKLFTCAEKIDLSKLGIGHSSCIDKQLIEQITGCRINAKKDGGQRPACGCIESIDIGSYNTCGCGCKYCYAVSSKNALIRNIKEHRPDSPILSGVPKGDEKVTDRTYGSLKIQQLSLY